MDARIEDRRRWLDGKIARDSAEFGVTIEGATVIPYDTRSIGAPVVDGDGTRLWLRVVVEDPDYQPACRWDGDVEANAIEGVPKPVVLRWADRTLMASSFPAIACGPS
ncbi:hypothetical protein [Amycolatopsis sp. CA-230715]|uniref:hypothetical protein n=1 Tax=Amycolatopsis sp. CA-230715 TaxID=2745196 RepID=UPI001C00BF23|nr:hypothetical protein [Amycolatopsis sp. CA-230715]